MLPTYEQLIHICNPYSECAVFIKIFNMVPKCWNVLFFTFCPKKLAALSLISQSQTLQLHVTVVAPPLLFPLALFVRTSCLHVCIGVVRGSLHWADRVLRSAGRVAAHIAGFGAGRLALGTATSLQRLGENVTKSSIVECGTRVGYDRSLLIIKWGCMLFYIVMKYGFYSLFKCYST